MDDIYKLKPGPILVLAGPGTGKTHTLAQRAHYFIEERKEVSPEEMTIITFTREAAFETMKRLSDPEKKDVYIHPKNQPNISTMHSLGNRVLRKHSRKVGLRKEFKVIDNDLLLKALMEDAAQICDLKREYADEVMHCRAHKRCVEVDEGKCRVCIKYREILLSANAIDFNEQIRLACKIFEKYPAVHSDFLKGTKHLLVDEYQDINASQFEMIRWLAKEQESGLFVVGDDDQSIYSWRGGSPLFIRNFEEDFKKHNPRVETLSECHRCPKAIHKASLKIVKDYDQSRVEKPIADNGYLNKHKTKVHSIELPGGVREAEFIATEVHKHFPAYSSLILIPRWEYAKPIKKALRSRRIPYDLPLSLKGSGLALLESIGLWLSNSSDNLVLRDMIRIILESKWKRRTRRWGEDRLARWNVELLPVSLLWNAVLKKEFEGSLMQVMKNTAEKGSVQEKIYLGLQNIWNASKGAPADFLDNVARELKLWNEDIQLLIDEIRDWCEGGRVSGAGRELVRIMTLNKAKGLSADYVYVVGLEDESFPGKAEGEALRERSRLLYVSMTRAKRELYLLWVRVRKGNYAYASRGGHTLTFNRSRFLDSIPSDLIDPISIWNK